MKQAKEPAMKLPDAELDIMMVLWSQPDPMTSSQIMAALEAGRQSSHSGMTEATRKITE